MSVDLILAPITRGVLFVDDQVDLPQSFLDLLKSLVMSLAITSREQDLIEVVTVSFDSRRRLVRSSWNAVLETQPKETRVKRQSPS